MSYQDGRQHGEAASYYNEPGYGGQPNSSQGGPQGGGPGQEGERGLMGGLAGAAAGAYGGHKMGHGIIGAIGGAYAGHKLEDFVHDRKDKKEEEKHHNQPPPGYYSGGSPQQQHSPSHHHFPSHHDDHNRDRSIGGGGGGGGGNFSASSFDIHLEGDFDLRATCRRADGANQNSVLNLNGIITNEDGRFRWAAAGGGGGGGGGSVTVQPGDTLQAIAQRVRSNVGELSRHNNISNPDLIYPGQVLRVPGGGGGGGGVGNFSSSARDIRLLDGGRVLEAELRDTRGGWHRSSINLDERIGNENGHLRFH